MMSPCPTAVSVPDVPSAMSAVDAAEAAAPAQEPVLCQHCGRTASNGISCQGACVADSGY